MAKTETCVYCNEPIGRDEPVVLDLYARVRCIERVIAYLGQYADTGR